MIWTTRCSPLPRRSTSGCMCEREALCTVSGIEGHGRQDWRRYRKGTCRGVQSSISFQCDNSSVPCLLVLVILLFPRVVLVLMFLLSDYLQRAYHDLII